MDIFSLIQRVKQGNKVAASLLVDHHMRLLYPACKKFIQDHQNIENTLQNAFVTMFRRIPEFTYQTDGQWWGWCWKIVKNHCLKYRTRTWKADEMSDHYLVPLDGARMLINRLSIKEIMSVINEINEDDRDLFMLIAVEQYKHKDVGDIFGITENAARIRFFKIRKRILALLKRKGFDYDN